MTKYRRPLVIALVYTGVITLSFYLAYEVRFDFIVPRTSQAERLLYLPFVIFLKLLALAAVGQLGSILTYFGIFDLLRLIYAMSGTSAIMFILRVSSFGYFAPPRGALLIDFLLCLGGLCFLRLGIRIYRERVTVGRGELRVPQLQIVIVGAGDAGASLASEFINAPARGFKPVAFFDDDDKKYGKLLHGVPVVGRPELMASAKVMSGVAKIVIAMPSAPTKRIREVILLANELKLKVETLPSLEELASGRVRSSRIRPVEVQDLLGRDPVRLDSEAIRKMIEGRVVMVTGAGGSIGGELCRQITGLNPKRLLMVEQAEGNLFNIEQELLEIGAAGPALPLVADILDLERMEFIFAKYHPELVFHAAAHKHVFMMERQPAEAIRNNVIGTAKLAELASNHGVAAFILISTDKAINPTSVMGATKRLAEIEILRIQASQKQASGTKYIAVRFGNVLGSSGSVIPIFKRQIARGGPVTVTHPDVTRYFMTIPEAVGLVLQSAALGHGGEVFVLDMGQPIKIIDLARQMIELSGFRPNDDIEIKFVGLKPGEKLYEELQHRTEQYRPTGHPRIMQFDSRIAWREPSIREFEAKLNRLETNELKSLLRDFVPDYDPHLD